jgi:hypothetical protein
MPWKKAPHRPKQRVLGPTDSRAPSRRTIYGITPNEQDAILVHQGGKCAGCGTTAPGGIGWCVDHDHACRFCAGAGCRRCVRGILCSPCNHALGDARDAPATLRSLADYLERQVAR